MQRVRFFLLILLVLSLNCIFVGCADLTANYYPLKVGNKWVYSTNIGMDVIIKVEGIQRVDGTDCFVLVSYSGEDEKKWIQKEFYVVAGKDILCYQRDYPKGASIKFVPPEKMLSINPKIGQSWIWEGKIGTLGFKYSFLVEKKEKIVIKSKNKTYNCLKLKSTGTSNDGINYQFNRWFVNKIGIVKEELFIRKGDKTLEVSTELKEYELK